MKQIGMVRRIDNLGRIVIPKEIRKTLHIHDGELLELLINNDEIVLKKYSSVREMNDIFKKIVSVFEENSSLNVLITDLDRVLVSSSKLKNFYSDKCIGRFIADLINNRKTYISNSIESKEIIDGTVENVFLYVRTLIVSGDVIGSFIILSDKVIENQDIRLADIICSFINKYMEE